MNSFEAWLSGCLIIGVSFLYLKPLLNFSASDHPWIVRGLFLYYACCFAWILFGIPYCLATAVY